MKIGVVGNGTVGRAVARTYLEYADVLIWDIIPERSAHTLREVLAADLVFVALPTPQSEGGLRADLTALHSFFSRVRHSDTNLVLRSTTPIGTTRKLAEEYDLPCLVHSPELLTAR